MSENMHFWPKNFWPPQSPDLNPLDFSTWWHIKSRAYKSCHSNVDALKASINQQWKIMCKDYVGNICRAFRSCLESVIKAQGAQGVHK